MSNKLKILVGVGATFLIVLIAAGLFVRHLITKSFPQTTGTLQLSCLGKPVTVYRDGLGVPHIVAENEDDAYAALGFVHAQDRLWQMELSRRIGQGRLSELFGSATLPFDKMLRTIGFHRIAQGLVQNLRPPERRALESYVNGVNAYIEMNRGKYPVEFDMLRIEPEPWTIENTVVISRLMAWELNMAWWFKIELGDIVDRFGEEKARALYPPYPASAPVIVGASASAGGFRERRSPSGGCSGSTARRWEATAGRFPGAERRAVSPCWRTIPTSQSRIPRNGIRSRSEPDRLRSREYRSRAFPPSSSDATRTSHGA